MAKQLGGLVSLLQGIDLAPMQLAQQRQLAQQQMMIQQQTSRAQDDLERRRLDLAEIAAKDNSAIERERIGLGREDLIARSKQADEQRGLDRELASMQQAGRVDIQELVGAQTMAQINLQDALSGQREQDRQDHEIEKQDRLLAAQGENLDKELAQNRFIADRDFNLKKQQGDDEAATNGILRERASLELVIAKRKAERMPLDEAADDELRKLGLEKAYLDVKLARHQAEMADPDSESSKAFRAAELELQKQIGRKTAAEATTEEQVGEAQKLQLDNAKKAAKEGSETESAAKKNKNALSKKEEEDYAAVSRKVDANEYEYGTGGGVLDLKKKAYEKLKELENDTDPDAEERRRLARMIIKDADKVGDKSYSLLQAYLPETVEEIDAESDPFDRLLGAAGYLGID